MVIISIYVKEIQLLESNYVINKLLESIKTNDENDVKVLTSNIHEVVITVGHNDKPKKKLVKQAIEL